MKKIALVVQLISIIIFSFSCKKDSTKANAESLNAGSLTVKVQGSIWVAASSSGYYDVGKNESTIMAGGTYSTENMIVVFAGRGIGTYKFGSYGSLTVAESR